MKAKRLIIFVIVFISNGLFGSERDSLNKIISPQEKHEVEVRLVLVDVIAMKGAKFFPELKREDFQIFDDGKEAKINSCDLISQGNAAIQYELKGKAKLPIITQKKRIAVLFDGINAWDRDLKRVAQQIADELVLIATGDVEVMVLLLDNEKGLKIVQPFTDQESLIRIAAKKATGISASPSRELLDYSDVLMMVNYMKEDAMKAGSRGGAPDPRAFYEIRAFEYANIATERLARTISGLMASLFMIENLPGRKNLLFVSGGFPDIDTFRMADHRLSLDDQFPFGGDISLYDPFGVLKQKVFRTGDEIVKEIIRVANDRNISIYSLDPGIFTKNILPGATAEYFDRIGPESQKVLMAEKNRQLQELRMISEKTGAEILRGANKIERFREMVRNDLSYYYQLSYYPSKRETKGYHHIEVKIKGRKDIEVRFREGYSDFSMDAAKRLILAKAFYHPETFIDKIPFLAEFVPLAVDFRKSQLWMNLALPFDELVRRGLIGAGKKTFEIHLWIKPEQETDKIIMGQISVPLDMDEIQKSTVTRDFIRLHFSGPLLELPDRGYRVIIALFDPGSGDIGAWVSNVQAPVLKKAKIATLINGSLVNAVFGIVGSKGKISLNNIDGGLEFGQTKFFPKVGGSILKNESNYFFCQIYYPYGPAQSIRFYLTDQKGLFYSIEGTKSLEFWDENSKIWSGIFSLDFKNIEAGNYLLKAEIPGQDEPAAWIRKIKLTL